MIVQFSPLELYQLSIQPVDRWERSPAYLDDREQVWTAEMEKVSARNDTMWNGEVYTLEAIIPSTGGQIALKVSTADYKDVIFRRVKGPTNLSEKYGPGYLFHFMAVECVPITEDGKFVFGIRSDWAEQGSHPVGIIGGGINKDEMEIHDFSDICRFMHKEIGEETAIQSSIEQLKLFVLVSLDVNYIFMFTLRLPVHSNQIMALHRDGEFSRLVAWTEQEAHTTQLPVSRAFRRWRTHLHALSDVAFYPMEQ